MWKKSQIIGWILFISLVFSFQIVSVMADVPTVLNIESQVSGTETILAITVTHSSPTSSHYVDKVEVDLDGNVQTVVLDPQSTLTFVVQYSVGVVEGTPSVRVRAHCNFHGWSGWSESLEVPEFSTISLIMIFAIISAALIVLKSKFPKEKKKLAV